MKKNSDKGTRELDLGERTFNSSLCTSLVDWLVRSLSLTVVVAIFYCANVKLSLASVCFPLSPLRTKRPSESDKVKNCTVPRLHKHTKAIFIFSLARSLACLLCNALEIATTMATGEASAQLERESQPIEKHNVDTGRKRDNDDDE